MIKMEIKLTSLFSGEDLAHPDWHPGCETQNNFYLFILNSHKLCARSVRYIPFQTPFDWPLFLYIETDSKTNRMLINIKAPSSKYTRVFPQSPEIAVEKEM